MTLEEFYQICDSIVPDEYGCHLYPGSKLSFYVRVYIKGREKAGHRLVLERKLGRPIQDRFYALHRCDTKNCLNPDHIYEGTPADNMRDRVERYPGTFGKWTEAYRAKMKIVFSAKGSEAAKAKYLHDPEHRAKIDASRRKGIKAAQEGLKKKYQKEEARRKAVEEYLKDYLMKEEI